MEIVEYQLSLSWIFAAFSASQLHLVECMTVAWELDGKYEDMNPSVFYIIFNIELSARKKSVCSYSFIYLFIYFLGAACFKRLVPFKGWQHTS